MCVEAKAQDFKPDDPMLSSASQEIAGEKAGILKPGCPAFTAPQPANAMGALQRRAAEVGAPLQVVPSFDSYRWATCPASRSDVPCCTEKG